MNKEKYFIDLFKNKDVIGDDGAVIGKKVYSTDIFNEDVHFKTSWMSLKQIAQKAMLVNISDAIVMNAIPKYALLSISIPKNYGKKELKQLANGFKKTAKKFGIKIIGGDTICDTKLNISITIISTTKNPTYRKGMKIGDLICYTNDLGSTKKDLNKLFENKKISKKSKFLKPKLHQKFFYEVSKYITTSMDISDGLFFELQRLSHINDVGFDFFDKIPKKIGCSGEEYEILFSFELKNKEKIEKIAKKHKIKLNIIAKAVNGTYKCKCKEHHFE